MKRSPHRSVPPRKSLSSQGAKPPPPGERERSLRGDRSAPAAARKLGSTLGCPHRGLILPAPPAAPRGAQRRGAPALPATPGAGGGWGRKAAPPASPALRLWRMDERWNNFYSYLPSLPQPHGWSYLRPCRAKKRMPGAVLTPHIFKHLLDRIGPSAAKAAPANICTSHKSLVLTDSPTPTLLRMRVHRGPIRDVTA